MMAQVFLGIGSNIERLDLFGEIGQQGRCCAIIERCALDDVAGIVDDIRVDPFRRHYAAISARPRFRDQPIEIRPHRFQPGLQQLRLGRRRRAVEAVDVDQHFASPNA